MRHYCQRNWKTSRLILLIAMDKNRELLEKFSAASQKAQSAGQPAIESATEPATEVATEAPTESIAQPETEIVPVDVKAQPRICFEHTERAGKYYCPVCLHWRCI